MPFVREQTAEPLRGGLFENPKNGRRRRCHARIVAGARPFSARHPGEIRNSPKQRFGDFVPGQPCVLGHVFQDRIERSNPEWIVERDRDVVLSVRLG